MKLFFCSKGLANKKQQDAFLAFAGSRRKVSVITTASEIYKEKNRNTVELKTKIETLGFEVVFVDIEFDSPKLLIESQVIIIAGGNPYFLLYHLKKSKADKVLKMLVEKNTPIMGISAGAFIFMNDLKIVDLLTPKMNNIGLEDKTGLGKINEIIIPHYDRFIKEGKIQKENIDQFAKKSASKIIRLGEFQTLSYTDDVIKLAGDLLK